MERIARPEGTRPNGLTTTVYYDQADNLVQTVPPKGVHPVTPQFDNQGSYTGPEPNHTYKTKYRYNSAGQVTNKKTPDGGNTNYWYNSKGQLKLSQKARQEEQTDSMYSYVKYDAIGRVTESGRVTDITKDSAWWNKEKHEDEAFLKLDRHNFPEANDYSLEEITEVHYSDPFNNGSFNQDNLRTRVATVLRKDKENATRTTVTNYSYDAHGNVKKLRQKLPGDLDPKITAYEYSLHSGNIKQVKYQQGEADMFLHKFIYDADNRLTRVKTSEDGKLWQEDARYFYYPHGPLKRMEAGEYKVQGKDYYYTLQGWVKGVNSEGLQPGNDPGSDGVSGSKNRYVGMDEYGYSLSYFNGDYHSIGSDESMFASKQNLPLSNEAPSLYNGNIRAMATTIQNTNDQAVPQLKTYEYDQLNRLRETEAWQSFNTTNNSWSNSAKNNYATSMSYDQDGNIQTLTRRNQSGAMMDNLDYNYQSGTSKLTSVSDAAGQVNGNDLADQPSGNYAYDASGNMTQDLEAGIDSISWTVDGKVKEVFRTDGSSMDDLEFVYDGMGNRVKKIVKTRSNGSLDPEEEWDVYYYVRDANGQLMSLYKKSYDSDNSEEELDQEEVPVYGSGRVAVYKPSRRMKTISSGGSVTEPSRDLSHAEEQLGNKSYQFTDHRGNVNVIVSDLKLGVDTDSDGEANRYDAQVESSKDYYAGGMTMPGRGFDPADSKYGFNGKRQDREMTGSGSHYDFGARMYDSRVGRWMSRDPLASRYPAQSAYHALGNNPIVFGEVDGRYYVIKIIADGETQTFERKNGQWESYDGSNKQLQQAYNKVKESMDYISNTDNPWAKTVYNSLKETDKRILIKYKVESPKLKAPFASARRGFNGNMRLEVNLRAKKAPINDSRAKRTYYQSVIMTHFTQEFGHAFDYINEDIKDYDGNVEDEYGLSKTDIQEMRKLHEFTKRKTKKMRSYSPDDEEYATAIQNYFAAGIPGEPLKRGYGEGPHGNRVKEAKSPDNIKDNKGPGVSPPYPTSPDDCETNCPGHIDPKIEQNGKGK